MARGKHAADSNYEYEPSKEEKIERNYEKEDIDPYDYKRSNGSDDSDDYDDYDYEEDEEAKTLRIRIICVVVAILLIIGVAVFITFKKPKEKVEENITPANVVENTNMIDTYEGYNVLGKIKIDKINVEQYILDSKEEGALKNGVIKLYGSSLNNYVNLCLAGHNYDEVFGKLNELDLGDTITLVEKDNKETDYKIKEIISVDPTDLTPLIQDDEKVSLTLITCENATTQRLIIKAEEK